MIELTIECHYTLLFIIFFFGQINFLIIICTGLNENPKSLGNFILNILCIWNSASVKTNRKITFQYLAYGLFKNSNENLKEMNLSMFKKLLFCILIFEHLNVEKMIRKGNNKTHVFRRQKFSYFEMKEQILN